MLSQLTYFNQARPHTCTCAPVQLSGDGTTDAGPMISPLGEPKAGKVIAFPVLNGLHRDYRWPAA